MSAMKTLMLHRSRTALLNQPLLLPTHLQLVSVPSRPFTRSVRKIVLTEDIKHLGFQGEICFVKPGYAFNSLVPQKQALFFTDPAAAPFLNDIDQAELKRKQEMRAMELFLSRLKNIKIVFTREVSEINKNVAKTPVDGQAILDQLNRRYNMLIRKEDFKMESGLDTIGEHFVPVKYTNE